MLRNFIFVFVASFISTSAVEEVSKTPEYILPCRKSDPDINTCLIKTFNHLRPYLVSGLNDIDVPTIDPLFISKINIENGNGPFRVRAFFNNVTTRGASNYTIHNIKADLDKYILDLAFKIPHVDIKGKYEIGGSVLLFPIRSKGDFWAVFTDVDATAKIYGKEVTKENVRYMHIDKLLVDFQIGKSKFKIKDVINLGNIIGEAINQFLNNNSDEIITEMKPAASISIARHFKTFLNGAFTKIPLKVWLPDA
ncbi:hypothetical protein PPYR_09772 [Photinus pyralis]|uniref:Haemolymph juvenile hormone binding protein n=1 Tax=Photinus pyralis TaxID=7054 RepID=A0A5N4AEG9_PHOPY|nr:protein takeout-like [Photinus pyralis]KAB0795711.1 hypothetical protein PPYR_09772 [Photinus pyralis]